MPMTTFGRFVKYTNDADINEWLDIIREQLGASFEEYIYVEEFKILEDKKHFFHRPKVISGYNVLLNVCCVEYQLINIHSCTKESVLAYLIGYSNGLRK